MSETFLNLFKLQTIRKFISGKNFGWWLGLLGVVCSSLLWITATFWQNTFALDQVKHLTIIRNLSQGSIPSYGPEIATTNLFLPANYYYFISTFGWISPETAFVALSNTLSQSVALFLLWRVLLKYTVNNPKYGSLLAALGVWLCGVNWAWFLLAVKIWNPNSLVLFSLIFVAWLSRLLTFSVNLLWQKKFELFAFGFFTAFWISFHSTGILIVPVLLSAFWIYRWGKSSFKTLGLVWMAGLVAWTPYWISEVQGGWQNSWGFIRFLFSNAGDLKTLGLLTWLSKRISGIFLAYPNIINTIYFDGRSFIGAIVIALVSVFALLKISKSSIYIRVWLGMLGIFILGVANLDWAINYHYMVLIFPVPIIGLVIFLSNLNKKILWQKVLACVTLCIVILSFFINIQRSFVLTKDRFDAHERDLNTSDYFNILEYMKNSNLSVLCVLPPKQIYQNHFEALKYYNKYITHTNIDIRYMCSLENTPQKTVFLIEKKASGDNQNLVIMSTFVIKQEFVYELRM